jgi:hypothetical protein
MKKTILILFACSLIFTACKKEEGCMDAIATNYNADAEEDDGSCIFGIVGVWSPYEVSVVGSQTVTVLGQTIASFDTSWTMTPAQAEIDGNIEFTNSGTIITTNDDGETETDNYTTSGNTLTVTDDDGEISNATYTVTKTNLAFTITDNQVEMVAGQTITSNTDMTIHCTRQ